MAKDQMPKLLERVPRWEALLALSERIGLTNILGWVFKLIASSVVLIMVWLYANLPWWGIMLVALASVALIATIIDKVISAFAATKLAMSGTPVDRAALADEADEVSGSIFALVADYQGPQTASWLEPDPGNFNERMLSKASKEGALIEKYGHRYLGPAWKIINSAKQVIDIDWRVTWRLQHVPSSPSDMQNMAMFLSKVAGVLRHGKTEMREDEIK